MAEKWPRFGGPRPSWELAWTMNWVDWLRTRADKRMWSGRRAVVMVWWAAVGCGCSALIRRSSWTGDWGAGHEGYPPPDCSGATGRRAELLSVKLGFPRSRCGAVVSDVLCVRSYVHFVCVCVYMCMCVCVRTWYMYVYACVYAFVHLCVYTHVYVYVYAYLCIYCGSWYQCFSVWTMSCMRMCFRVHMHAYMYVCRYIYTCIFLQWVLHALYRCFGH